MEFLASGREAKDALFEQFARVSKPLSSSIRLELLDLLAQGERPVDSLARAANLKLITASAHLQTLKESRLVATRPDGTTIYYRLAGEDVAGLHARLQTVAQTHLTDVAAARMAFLRPDAIRSTGRSCGAAYWQVTSPSSMFAPRPGVRGRAHPGALSVPLDQLATRLAELPADIAIVALPRRVLRHVPRRGTPAAGEGPAGGAAIGWDVGMATGRPTRGDLSGATVRVEDRQVSR
jgi:DNA-binding transcriptional ArsR family regulator